MPAFWSVRLILAPAILALGLQQVEAPQPSRRLRILTVPVGANVWIGRTLVGTTSAEGLEIEVPKGLASLTATMEGFKPAAREIEIEPGQDTLTVELTLHEPDAGPPSTPTSGATSAKNPSKKRHPITAILAGGLVLGAGAAVLASNGHAAPPATPPPAAPVESSFRVTATDVPKDIPNRTTISSMVQVNSGGRVISMAVTVSISHPYRGEVDVFLQHPDGTRAAVYVGDSGDTNADIGGVFDLQRSPELQRFLGKPVSGIWTLMVSDTRAENRGTLNGWAIDFRVQQ